MLGTNRNGRSSQCPVPITPQPVEKRLRYSASAPAVVSARASPAGGQCVVPPRPPSKGTLDQLLKRGAGEQDIQRPLVRRVGDDQHSAPVPVGRQVAQEVSGGSDDVLVALAARVRHGDAPRPFAERAVYVNDLGEEEADRVQEAYGANYARLATIKAAYDPTNFFRANQNVAPMA